MLTQPNVSSQFTKPFDQASASLADNKILANIELKSPRDLAIRKQYDTRKCAQIVHELIQSYNLAEYCIVQSFDSNLVDQFEEINREWEGTQKRVHTLHIHNFYYNVPIEREEDLLARGCGGNL